MTTRLYRKWHVLAALMPPAPRRRRSRQADL